MLLKVTPLGFDGEYGCAGGGDGFLERPPVKPQSCPLQSSFLFDEEPLFKTSDCDRIVTGVNVIELGRENSYEE